MQDAYTAKEIARAIKVTRQAIQQRATSEGWEIHHRGEGKAWRTVYFTFPALPADIREALARVAASEAAAAGRREGLKLKLSAEAKAESQWKARQQGAAQFMSLSEAARERAELRAALLVACRDYTRAAGLATKPGRAVFCRIYNAGEISIAPEIREAIPKVSPNSLYNWDKQLKEQGMARLGGKHGLHRRGTGVIESTPDLQDFILGLLEHNPDHTATYIQDGISGRFPDVQLSLRVLQRWLKDWKAANPRRYQEMKDPDKARSLYQPADGSRIEGIVRPNQRWEMDSTKGDVIINDNGTRTRHMIVGCIDVFTRRMKLFVSRSSNSAAVASLMRRCLLDWGQVEELGTDNGTDFVSKHIRRIASALEIHRDVAKPFTPEHKPFIERSFGTFLHGLLHGAAGFIGHSVAERKGIENRKSFAKRVVGAWRKGGKEEAPVELLMTPEQLQEFCDKWTDALYANRRHWGEGMNGKTPLQKAAEYSGPPLKRIDDERALDVLLSPVPRDDGWCKIAKKGIRVDNFRYTSPLLGGHEGKQALVLLDDTDWGAVYVFLPNAHDELEFVCRAVCPEILGTSRREAAMARRRVYDAIRKVEREAARARAKAVRPQDVFREIMENAVKKAGKLTHLPQPTIPHETEALRQAGFAAKAQDGPDPAPADQAQAMREYAAREMARPAVVHQMPQSPLQRYRRWVKLDEALQAGAELPPEDQSWWRIYQNGKEFRSMRDQTNVFGAAKGV